MGIFYSARIFPQHHKPQTRFQKEQEQANECLHTSTFNRLMLRHLLKIR